MIKIRNHNGKIICYADPDNGAVEIKYKNIKQKVIMVPGQKLGFESDDGYITVLEYEEPGRMFSNTYKNI